MPYKCVVPGCRANYPGGPKVSVFSFPRDSTLQVAWLRAIQRKHFRPTTSSKMGKCCIVSKCQSNLRSQKEYTSVFSFPTDPKLRTKWIRNIHREDSWSPGPYSGVCIKHFAENFIIREDVAKRSDGTILRVTRNRPGLTTDAYPTIFQGQLPYNTTLPPPTAHWLDPSEGRASLVGRDKLRFQKLLLEDKVCERHFTEDDIKRSESMVVPETGDVISTRYLFPRLHKGAVPSLSLGHKEDTSPLPSSVEDDEVKEVESVVPVVESEETFFSKFEGNYASSQPEFHRCCAPHCKTHLTESNSTVKLFQFPLEPERCREWVRLVGDKELVSLSVKDLHYLKYLCGAHFPREDFTPKGYLKKTAVPLKFHRHVKPLSEEDLAGFSLAVESEDDSSEEPETAGKISQRHKRAAVQRKPKQEALQLTPPIRRVECQVPWNADGNNLPSTAIGSAELSESFKHSEKFKLPNETERTASLSSEQLPHTVHLQPNNQKAMNYERLLETVRKQLCRICGKKRDVLFPICGDEECGDSKDELSLAQKIEMYLPMQTSKDDELPRNICLQCRSAVELWHELHMSFLAADSILRKVFFEKNGDLLENQINEMWLSLEDIRVSDNTLHAPVLSDMSPVSQSGNYGSQDDPETAPQQQREEEERQILPNNIHYISCNSQNTGVKWLRIVPLSQVNPSDVGISVLCKYCNEAFSSKEECSVHQKQCAVEPAMCDQCGRTGIEKRRLKAHMGAHVAPSRVLICEKCGRQLSTSYKLKCHIIAKHSGKRKPTLFCEPCCRLFVNLNSYRTHMWQHRKGKIKNCLNVRIVGHQEEGGEMLYKCPVCREDFPDKMSVVLHLRSRKKTKCSQCKTWMANERDILLHKCKFKACRFCRKLFSAHKNRVVHERIHTGEKPFSCAMCGALFISMTALNQHRTSHMPPQFSCEQCGKRFRKKRDYLAHKEIHEGVQYVCGGCGKLCITKRALLRHEKLVHDNC